MHARRSGGRRALEKRKPRGVDPAARRTTTRTRQHSVHNSPQESRAIRARLTAAEWKALYVALYCHDLLPARSLIALFFRHPEWRHA